MEPARWFTLLALCLLLAEGFMLSVMPLQFQHWIEQANPRTLQLVGLVETMLVLGLMAGVLLG